MILKRIALYVLSVGMVAYGGFTLYGEKSAKVTDPHAIILGIGLLLIPDLAGQLAASIKQVGGAIAESWKAKNP